MTLMREMIGDWNFLSMGSMASPRTPSMRYLIWTSLVLATRCGCREARFWTAVKMMVLTSLMIEPSWSASFSMEMTSSSSPPSRSTTCMMKPSVASREDLQGGLALAQGLLDGPLGGGADHDLLAQEGLDGVDGGDVRGVGDGDLQTVVLVGGEGDEVGPVEELRREATG